LIQSATVEAGITVEESLLIGIAELNAQLAPGDIGPIGAVVGPVDLNPALDLTAVNGIFLAPGVGAQGASPADVARIFAACPERVIPSASRSLLLGGPDLARLRHTAESLATEFRALLTIR
jgi:hypothetical protein